MARRYGRAGSGISGAAGQARYGRQSAMAGAAGERRLAGAISRSSEVSGYMSWSSLGIPTPRGGERYSSDVDIALASGNRLVLVDAKMWAAGKIYWSILGYPMRGLAPMRSKGGLKRLSRNMETAVARYRSQLPGHVVKGVVVFVPTSKGGGLPASVRLLRWPGGIRSYLVGDGLRRISSALGAPEEPSAEIQGLLGRMTK